jgi:hypothetical protein
MAEVSTTDAGATAAVVLAVFAVVLVIGEIAYSGSTFTLR